LTKKKEKKKKLTKTKTNKHEYLFFVLHFETSKIRLAETIQSVVAAHSESQATQRYSHNILSLLVQISNAVATSAARPSRARARQA
jgi:hypothetical protein